MNCLERDMKTLDGTIDTLIISSNDNTYSLDGSKTYKLVNNTYTINVLGKEIDFKSFVSKRTDFLSSSRELSLLI